MKGLAKMSTTSFVARPTSSSPERVGMHRPPGIDGPRAYSHARKGDRAVGVVENVQARHDGIWSIVDVSDNSFARMKSVRKGREGCGQRTLKTSRGRGNSAPNRDTCGFSRFVLRREALLASLKGIVGVMHTKVCIKRPTTHKCLEERRA